ncbi:hypothetical protein, partial [Klebsiella pneumoniae]|uniref:hypothetical protein n=1 Tax=Klebsiella pneumoniae TaxID=573 RepID=UPI001954F0A4
LQHHGIAGRYRHASAALRRALQTETPGTAKWPGVFIMFGAGSADAGKGRANQPPSNCFTAGEALPKSMRPAKRAF